MRNLEIKLKELYFPFLKVSSVIISSYTFLRWLIDIELNLFHVDEMIFDLYVPLGIVFLFVPYCFRERVKILAPIRKNRRIDAFLYYLMSIAILASLILIQGYVIKKSFSLNKVSTVNSVDKANNEIFYEVSSFNIVNLDSKPYFSKGINGRLDATTNVYIYFVFPFEDSDLVWCGVKFSRAILNSVEGDILKVKLHQLVESCKKELIEVNFQEIKYFEKVRVSKDKENFIEAIKRNNVKYKEGNNYQVIIPHTNSIKHRSRFTALETIGFYLFLHLLVLVFLLRVKIDEQKLRNYKPSKS